MIVSITSKRGGTGCTTLALTAAVCMTKKFSRKTCLVDLKTGNDIARLLTVKNNYTIDNLITEIGINTEYINVSDSIYNYNGLDVLPGTVVRMPMFLYKRTSKIKDLLSYLDSMYDLVILDIDDGLVYKELKSLGLDTYPVNVIDQNMLSVLEYQYDIRKGTIKGLIVVNKMDNSVYPSRTEFDKNFNKDRLFYVPESNRIKHLMNRVMTDGFNLKQMSSTEYFKSVFEICRTIDGVFMKIQNSTIEGSNAFSSILQGEKPKKEEKGFMSFLFKSRKGGKK